MTDTAVPDWIAPLIGETVVCDLDGGFVVVGLLQGVGAEHLAFAEADLHDMTEGNSTREVYALESKRLGVRANRDAVLIPRRRVIAISRLSEVLG